MKILKCDICGKNIDDNYKLCDVLNDLKVGGIEHICLDCNSEISKARDIVKKSLYQVELSWVKKIMLKLKKDKEDPTTPVGNSI